MHLLEVKYNQSSFTIKSYRFGKSKRVGFRYIDIERYEQVIDEIEKMGYTVIGKDGCRAGYDYIMVQEFMWLFNREGK